MFIRKSMARIVVGLTFLSCAVVNAGQPLEEKGVVVNSPGEEPMAPVPATRTVGTVEQTPTTIAADVGTVNREPVHLEDARHITVVSGDSLVQLGVLTPLQVPERDLQTVALPIAELVAAPGGLDQNLQPSNPTITVNEPEPNESWVAGTAYPIRWGSTNLNTPVKIHLVHAASASEYLYYAAAEITPNDGYYTYTPPAMLGYGWDNFYVQVASLDENTKGFGGPIKLYHEPVDMTGMIVDLDQRTNVNKYVDNAYSEWLRFHVWFRNNGTQQSTSIQTIRAIVIKEPEEVVVDGGHIEFGFNNIAPRLWYSTPDFLKVNILKFRNGQTNINMEEGQYRLEVTIDPLNLLGEDPPMLEDNHFVQRFEIRHL